MSKKTENIYKSIATLEDLQNQISIINQMAKNGTGSNDESDSNRHLENIEFEMGQAIKELRFWIGSLYSYNGKSTSRAKQTASKENGKKGGRPPKRISELRKRKKLLEAEIIPELESNRRITVDFDEENRLSIQIEQYQSELQKINEELDAYLSAK